MGQARQSENKLNLGRWGKKGGKKLGIQSRGTGVPAKPGAH